MQVTNATYPIPVHPTWDITDTSKMKDYCDCPRKYFWNHVLGWSSDAPNNHLIFGEAIHRALSFLLQTDYSSEAIYTAYSEKFLPYYRQHFPPQTDALMKAKTPESVILMLPRYAQTYKDDFVKYEVLHVEVGGAVPVSSSRVVHLRIDAILRHRLEGYVFCQEHKSGSGITRFWTDQWDLDLQPGTYTHAVRSAFPSENVKGTQINGIHFKVTKSREFKNEFIRLPIWKSGAHLLTWLVTVNRIIDEIEHDFRMLANEDPANEVMSAFRMNPGSCTKYFGCPYHNLCCSWPNPLARCDRVQMGFKVEFWDPRELEVQYQLENIKE